MCQRRIKSVHHVRRHISVGHLRGNVRFLCLLYLYDLCRLASSCFLRGQYIERSQRPKDRCSSKQRIIWRFYYFSNVPRAVLVASRPMWRSSEVVRSHLVRLKRLLCSVANVVTLIRLVRSDVVTQLSPRCSRIVSRFFR